MLGRRNLTAILAGGALGGLPRTGVAQMEGYPSRPIRMLVGFPPGGLTDIVARVVGEGLARRLNGAVVVENRPGASGNLAAAQTARAPADGYTLYLAAVGLATTVAVNPAAMQIDPLTELSHIALVGYTANTLIVGPRLGEVPDARALVELARRRPGMTFGSSGSGGGLHLTGEMFKLRTGIDIQHVSYRGANLAMNDLLAGQLDMSFDNVSGALPFIRDGRVRALAVTSAERLPELPDVPSMAELGIPGMEVGAWFGVMGPAGLPPGLLDRLAREVTALLGEPRVVEQFARIGLGVRRSDSPAAFTAYFREDVAKWRAVVQAAGLTFDPN